MSEDMNTAHSREDEESRKPKWESASSRRPQRKAKNAGGRGGSKRGYRDWRREDSQGKRRQNREARSERRWEDREDYRGGSRGSRRPRWEDGPREDSRSYRDGRRGGYRGDRRDEREGRRAYREDSRYGRGGRGDGRRDNWREDRREGRREYREDSQSYREDRRGGYRDDRRGQRSDNYRDERNKRPRDPQIPESVSPRDLDADARAHLRSLSKDNANRVARHLVYAGSMMDENPELAYEHAYAAYRHAARIDIVREALGLTSYLTGRYSQALRELRTYRRMTDDYSHVAIEADSERGLGRTEKALRFIDEIPLKKLDNAARIELALVKSGARADSGDSAGALEVIERIKVDNLDKLLRARIELIRADRYEELGRSEEAAHLREKWEPIFEENGEVDWYEEEIAAPDCVPSAFDTSSSESAPSPEAAESAESSDTEV